MPNTISLKGWIFICILFASGTAGGLLYKAMCMLKVVPGAGLDAINYDHAYL